MKALVTGAHGFLGRHVARALSEAGHLVIGIGHGTWTQDEYSSFGLTFWHQMDVTLDALTTYGEVPDVIIHCAGSGSVGFSMAYPHLDFGRTVVTTASVLEYIRLYSPKTILVCPSSVAVHGHCDILPIKETDAVNPISPYGTHKAVAEQLCRSYGRNYGVAVATIRFFSIFGEGLRKQLLWDACNKASRGDNSFTGSGNELRDWLHVEDAAALAIHAIRHASPDNPTVNGGTGEAARVSEVLEEVFRAYGSDATPKFTGRPRQGDPPGYQADISRSQAWGFKSKIPWRDGVRRYVAWFKRGYK